MKVKFFDFSPEIDQLGDAISATIERVVRSGRYILGPELQQLEERFAHMCAADQAVGVASGTDALFLALKAFGVGPGDEVITVANTFAATALAIIYTGATPVFVDIQEDSFLIDVDQIEGAITERTKAIIPVHLYGCCADMDAIMQIAERHGLYVLEDACQAHTALYKGRRAGSLGHAAAFSFYPTKNLGAYGDAGIITVNDPDIYRKLKLLRNYGQVDRYHYELAGYNSRLDEVQAAILNLKMDYLEEWTARRQKIAKLYDEGLAGFNLVAGRMHEGSNHVYHLYVMATDKRDTLMEHLESKGIGTLIHYPVPLHKQPAFAAAREHGHQKYTMLRSGQIMSLPMHPWISDQQAAYLIKTVRSFLS